MTALRLFQCATALAVAVVVLGTGSAAQGVDVRFTALAVNMGSPWPSGAATVDIDIDRWSTDGERQRLFDVLREQGPDSLLTTLQDLPRVGSIRTPNAIGYPLHFAQRMPDGDGGERVVLATDRYISFWEAANRPRTIGYPFTIIDMRIGSDGQGQGKMSLATKVSLSIDGKTIELENFATQPVRLTSVRRTDR